MATKRFIKPFGEDGLRVPISDTPSGTDVNYETGYPEQYGFDPVTDPEARFVELTQENQILNDITGNIKLWQEDNYPDFITAANNGGVAHEYKKGIVVSYNGELYESLEDANTDLPTTEKWVIHKPNDVLRALLIGLGYSGNYGFFEKGFVYREVGDLGFSSDGVAYIYAGVDLLPVTVPNGTDPEASSDYESVTFGKASSVTNENGGTAQDQFNIKNGLTVSEAINYAGIASLVGSRVWLTDRKSWFNVVLTSSFSGGSAAGKDELTSIANSAYGLNLDTSKSVNLNGFGLSESEPDNAIFFNRAVELIKSKANDVLSNLGVQCVNVPAGKYPCLTKFTTPPWIQFKSDGMVTFDYSGYSTPSEAIKVSNDDETFDDDKNAASNSKVFSGRFYVKGPGTGVAGAVGIRWGNTSASGADFRDVVLGDIVVQEFLTPIVIHGYNTYINAFKDSRFELGGNAVVYLPDSAGVNSGERMYFNNVTIAGAVNGLVNDDIGSELLFDGCSFDFCRDRAANISDTAGFQLLAFNMTHFENCNDVCVIEGTSTDRDLSVSITSSSILPKNNVKDGSLPFGRTDGLSVPRTELFKDYMNLTMNGVSINGYNNRLNTAEVGLFMCDENVSLSEAKGITFTGFTQSISRSLINNYNWKFNESTLAAVIEDLPNAGFFCIARTNGINSQIVNTESFDGSTQSLQLSSTFALTESYELATAPAPINSPKLGSNVIMKAPNTAGDLRCEVTPIYYKYGEIIQGSVASLTRSSTIANVVTSSPHGLSRGRVIRLKGVDQTEWNHTYMVRDVVSTTEFRLQALTTYNGTPTGTITFETVDNLEPFSTGATSTSIFGDGYDDTDDPSYQADRDYFARARNPHRQNVPQSAVAVSLVCRFTQIDVGSNIFIGGVYSEKIW